MLYLLYRFADWLVCVVPLRCSYVIGGIFAEFYFFFAKRRRAAVVENLRMITGAEKLSSSIVREVFRNFSRYLAEFFYIQKIGKKFINRKVRIENIEYISEALSLGKGAIALSAHIGNWELAGLVLAAQGLPVEVVALSHRDSRIEKYFIRQRTRKGISVIPLGSATKDCVSALMSNRIVGLLGDRDFSGTGVEVFFFGKKIRAPQGPAALSLKTGAPIVPVFMIMEKRGRFSFIFEKPVEYIRTGDREKDIRALTQRCVGIIESYVRRYPEQWLVFSGVFLS